MFNSLRAEFRKLFTIRSTYVLTVVIMLLSVALVCFWIYGYKNAGHAQDHPRIIFEMLFNASAPAGLFMGIIAILAVGHEYRYNTILYSLTNVNRRSKLFFAKLLALLIWAAVLCALVVGLGIPAFFAGQHLGSVATASQIMPDASFIGLIFATMLGFAIFGYLIAMLLRSLVGAIVVFLILPTTVENLLSLLLKDNTKYLPFTALGNVANTSSGAAMSHMQSLWVVLAYVIGVGAIAYVLFLKRDAN